MKVPAQLLRPEATYSLEENYSNPTKRKGGK